MQPPSFHAKSLTCEHISAMATVQATGSPADGLSELLKQTPHSKSPYLMGNLDGFAGKRLHPHALRRSGATGHHQRNGAELNRWDDQTHVANVAGRGCSRWTPLSGIGRNSIAASVREPVGKKVEDISKAFERLEPFAQVRRQKGRRWVGCIVSWRGAYRLIASLAATKPSVR